MIRLVWRHCLAGLLFLPALSGCASFNARMAAFLQCKAEERVQQAQLCQQELETLKAELEQERESIRHEREMELQALRAETERRRDCAREKVDESVRTRVGIDLDQRVKLGQLQVDMEKLKQVLDDREADFQFRKRVYDDMAQQRELQDRARLLAELRNREAATQQQQAAVSAPQDCSCGAAAQCVCPTPANACDCGAARHCSCGALVACSPPNTLPLRDCGGPNLPVRQPLKQPVRQPILPTEIPLMLPVTLEVNLENVALGPSRVRQLPMQQFPLHQHPTSPLKQPCAPKHPCGHCTDCRTAKVTPDCNVPNPANAKYAPEPGQGATSVTRDPSHREVTESAPANYIPHRTQTSNPAARTATNDYFTTPRNKRSSTKEPELIPGTDDSN